MARSILPLLVSLEFVGSFGVLAGSVKYQPNTVQVVVVAHQDDWQLFMGDAIARELKSGHRVAFIYLTAGDDGRDSLYWQTRERAALRSTATAIGIPASDGGERCIPVVVRTHTMPECTVGNTVSYFLRLPDGNRNGRGFARYGNASLRKLRTRTIPSITSVDQSTSYHGWEDLTTTVQELISRNSANNAVDVHTTDPSVAINPHDHFDHRLAGLLVLDLRPGLERAPKYYLGYAVATRAANRTSDQVREKTAIFGSYNREMTRVNSKWSAYAEHPAFYSQCMARTYRRTAPRARRR